MNIEKYRYENGKLFVFSSEHKCYLFVGCYINATKEQAIADYEEWLESSSKYFEEI